MPTNREKYKNLTRNFTKFLNEQLSTKLKERVKETEINTEILLKSKSVLSNVHNMLTYKTTVAFLEWLHSNTNLLDDKNEAKKDIDETSTNANGYDVVIKDENGKAKILAEIKCNVPILDNGEPSEKFGANQKDGIKKDIKKLNGETDSKKASKDFSEDAIKFMVLLDVNGYKARKAFNNSWDTLQEASPKRKLVLAETETTDYSDPENIYVVFVKI